MAEINTNQKNFKGKSKSKDAPPEMPLPQNLAAEMSVIGAVLHDNNAFDEVAGILKAEHFHDAQNIRIWEMISESLNRGGGAYATLIAQHMSPADAMSAAAADYLQKCVTTRVSLSALIRYAKEIVHLHAKRSVIQMCGRLTLLAHGAEETNHRGEKIDILGELEEELAGLRGDGRSVRISHIGDSLKRVIEDTEAARGRKGALNGLTTGFTWLDNEIGGIEPEMFTIIAGRSSHGKTVLALNMAMAQAKAGHPVAFISMETGEKSLARRILAAPSGVSPLEMKRGTINDAGMASVREAADGIGKLPLHIVEPGSMSPADLRLIVRKMQRMHGIEAVYIDYLQLMRAPWGRSDYEKITAISAGIRPILQELRIPMFGLAQVNRSSETDSKEGRRPKKSDLKSSGQLEQDADVVIMTYREEQMIIERKPNAADAEATKKWEAELASPQVKGRADIILAKNKDGGVAERKMSFDGPRMRFYETNNNYGGQFYSGYNAESDTSMPR